MPTDQSNRVWSSWPWRDRENGRAREQSWILARRNAFFSPFHHLRSFDRSIPRKNVYLFAAHFSLDRVTLSSTKETETEKSIGFVRKLRRDCEIFPDSPEMWAPLMALVGFNVNNSLLKRIRQPCLVEARIGPREFHSKDVDREREREGEGVRTSCMRVQRNSNRDTTVGPAANYTYGSYYASERRKFSIGNLTDVCIQRFRFNRTTCYNKMFELYFKSVWINYRCTRF